MILKLQIPGDKLQQSFKRQTPISVVCSVAVFLALDAWGFSGAWCLVPGISSSTVA